MTIVNALKKLLKAFGGDPSDIKGQGIAPVISAIADNGVSGDIDYPEFTITVTNMGDYWAVDKSFDELSAHYQQLVVDPDTGEDLYPDIEDFRVTLVVEYNSDWISSIKEIAYLQQGSSDTSFDISSASSADRRFVFAGATDDDGILYIPALGIVIEETIDVDSGSRKTEVTTPPSSGIFIRPQGNQ